MTSHVHPIFTKLAIVLVGILASSSLGAVDPAVIKIGGQVIQTLGPKVCKESPDAEIGLPASALKDNDDFRAMAFPAKKSTDGKTKTSCDTSVSEIARLDISFSKNSPVVSSRKLLPDSACSKEGSQGNYLLCIYDTTGKELLSSALIPYNTAAAKVEGIEELVAENGEIRFKVKFTSGQGSPKFETCHGKTSEGNIDEADCPSTFTRTMWNDSRIAITGLANDVEYGVKARINDGSETSAWTASVKATPIRVAHVFTAYDGKGGDVQFSCQQSGASSLFLMLFVVAILLLARSRNIRRHGNNLLVLSIIVLAYTAAKPSHAYLGQMNVGILGSMYRPNLDGELTASGDPIFPFYKSFFRRKLTDQDGPINPLMGAEIDWHIWDGFGSLQVGVGLGYTYVRGRALKYDANGMPNPDDPLENSKVSLHMYQVRPQITYLFNQFAHIVPLIPYVRGALIAHGYSFFRGDKSEAVTNINGTIVKPHGFRFGYQGALGLMLMLDFLEPSSVRTASGQGLLNHIYLKGELSITKIDTFGRRGFQFSAKDVMGTSLPLLWTFGLVFELP